MHSALTQKPSENYQNKSFTVLLALSIGTIKYVVFERNDMDYCARFLLYSSNTFDLGEENRDHSTI